MDDIAVSSVLAIGLAAFLLAIVPGPTVSLIIANSMRAGSNAGLLNIAGTQLGLIFMIIVVGLGLKSVMAVMANWFFVIKLVGAAYLIYLGIKMLRSTGEVAIRQSVKPPGIGYFWQGFLVILTNPKALLFYGAFIPQFVEPSGNTFVQSCIYGMVFMVVAGGVDMFYALVAGRAGSMLAVDRPNLSFKWVERLGGAVLVAGGLWMASLQRS